eukprot:scaffold53584_cov44-Phaeocystis_antarctica.AAC.1
MRTVAVSVMYLVGVRVRVRVRLRLRLSLGSGLGLGLGLGFSGLRDVPRYVLDLVEAEPVEEGLVPGEAQGYKA